MAASDIIMPAPAGAVSPVVRSIGFADLRVALQKGLDDFRTMPTHVPFLILIYPVIGVLLAGARFDEDMLPLLFPVIAGLALVGPLSAIWLFELSRRREMGLDVSWRHAFDIVRSPSFPAIAAVCGLLLAIFALWLVTAQALFHASLGFRRIDSAAEFLRLVFYTPEGASLVIRGNVAGFLFAALAATISVVSLPLLLDRDVGFPAAIATSFRVVIRNPVVMAVWGLVVAFALLVGALPFFLGLAIVFPILGHATWHLYRRAIGPAAQARPACPQRRPGVRRVADFPASLFFPARDDAER